MVVGNGMIAQIFGSYHAAEDVVIFASGVSQSTCTDVADFEREKTLLTDTIQQAGAKELVYFSTCGIYDPSLKQSAYIQHKLSMEAYIKQHQQRYKIFRLSNPIGRTTNNNTFVNFFINNIQRQTPFSVWKHASRNVIDIDDMYIICHELLKESHLANAVINIANPTNYPVLYILNSIEKHLNIQGVYKLVDKGDSPVIDVSAISPLFEKYNINFGERYLERILQKYFPVQ